MPLIICGIVLALIIAGFAHFGFWIGLLIMIVLLAGC